MTQIRRRQFLFATGGLLAFPALSTGQTEERIVKPEIRVGDSWTYRSMNFAAPGTHDVEHRVSFTDDKAILLVTTIKGDDKEIDSTYTSDWNTVSSYGGLIVRPHSGLFQFPLRIGDKREVKSEILQPRAALPESASTGLVTVVGWETVEVPAGKFRAIKVAMESMVKRSDRPKPYPRRVTVWYVPNVRRWVKFLGDTPILKWGEELLAFKLNED